MLALDASRTIRNDDSRSTRSGATHAPSHPWSERARWNHVASTTASKGNADSGSAARVNRTMVAVMARPRERARRSRYAVPSAVRPGRINTNDQVVTVLHGVHHPVLGNDLQFELRIRERETYLCAASTTCANTTDALTRRRPPETGARDVIASPASSISASKPWVLS